MSKGNSSELPEGWIEARLPDVVVLNPPKPKASDHADDLAVTFVPMPAVDALSGTIANPVSRKFSDVRKGFTAFRDEDVILAKITPCMENGKAAIARNLVNGLGFGSTEFHVLRSNGALLPDYLFYFIRQETFRRMAEAQMTGSVGQKRVPAEFLVGLTLPVPPLAEQRRIVAAVERVLVSVAAARDKLERVPKTLRRFRQAVLAAACSGRLTADWRETDATSDWKSTTLEDLIQEKPRNGFSPKAVDRPTAVKSLTLTATTSGVFKPEHFKYLDVELASDSYLWLQPGDILIQRSNTAEYVGVSAVFDGDAYEFVYPDLMMKIRAKEGVDSRFLWCALSDEGTRNYFRENATGTAGNMPKINQGIVCSTPVNLPPHAEQLEIVRRVSRLMGLADSIEQRAMAAFRRVELLTQAVLMKAFRGELVPTEAELARKEGRNYEPANVLLTRLKASVSGEPKGSRVRKTSKRSASSGNGLLEFGAD